MKRHIMRPSSLIFLFTILALSGCGGCSQFEPGKRLGPEHITHLTYQINLPKGSDGKYKAKVDQEIIITAEARGPYADTVKWVTNVEEVKGTPSYSGDDLGRTPPEQFANLVKVSKRFSLDNPCQIEVTCVPITTNIKHGKKLLKGTKKFEIVVE